MRNGDRVQARSDGQLGFLEEDESGALIVRLDRPAQARQVVPYDASNWLPARQERFTNLQVSRICYASDREIRLVRGEYGVPGFHEMKDQQRQKMLNGPVNADDLRREIWEWMRARLERA